MQRQAKDFHAQLHLYLRLNTHHPKVSGHDFIRTYKESTENLPWPLGSFQILSSGSLCGNVPLDARGVFFSSNHCLPVETTVWANKNGIWRSTQGGWANTGNGSGFGAFWQSFAGVPPSFCGVFLFLYRASFLPCQEGNETAEKSYARELSRERSRAQNKTASSSTRKNDPFSVFFCPLLKSPDLFLSHPSILSFLLEMGMGFRL